MSDGPIKAAREAFARRDPVTTNPEKAIHAVRGKDDPRPYCGTRRGKVTTLEIELVTCSNCTAAISADHTDGDRDE